MAQEAASVELQNFHSTSADYAIQPTEPTLPTPTTRPDMRQSRAIIVILQLTAITALTSISSGLMTVSIPRIASDLDIQPQLYYW